MDDNPYLLAYSNLSFISSMYTLFGAIVFVLAKLQDNRVTIVWIILISLIFILQTYISIKSLVIGIKGLARKRKTPDDFIANDDNI